MTTEHKNSATTGKPVWFITGCSTGFGHELAKQALERGYRTVVTARQPDEVNAMAARGEALVLKLDVTNHGQIDAAIKAAEDRFGRIDVLVNNAGIGYFGAVEESEEDQVRRMFEINVFGLSRMIHAVLPGMRQRRHGFIVNFSSLAGLHSFPALGYYNATKFAVEGLSGALCQEVEPLGIKVIIVEPSGFRTDWAGRSANESKQHIADYAATAGYGANKRAKRPVSSRVTRFAPRRPSSRRSSPRNRRVIFFLAMTLLMARWRSLRNCERNSPPEKRWLAGPISPMKSMPG